MACVGSSPRLWWSEHYQAEGVVCQPAGKNASAVLAARSDPFWQPGWWALQSSSSRSTKHRGIESHLVLLQSHLRDPANTKHRFFSLEVKGKCLGLRKTPWCIWKGILQKVLTKSSISNKLQLMLKAGRARSLQQAMLAIACIEMMRLPDLMEVLTLLAQWGIAAFLKAFLKAHKKPPLMHAENETQAPHLMYWFRRNLNKQFGNYTPFWRFQKASSVAFY